MEQNKKFILVTELPTSSIVLRKSQVWKVCPSPEQNDVTEIHVISKEDPILVAETAHWVVDRLGGFDD